MAQSMAEAFGEVFRDFAVEGVPASGANEPAKPAIRSLGPLLDQKLAAAGIGDPELIDDLMQPYVDSSAANATSAETDANRADAAAAAAEEAAENIGVEVVPDDFSQSWGSEGEVVFGVTTRGVMKAQMFDVAPDETFGSALVDRASGALLATWGADGSARFGPQTRLSWKAWTQPDGDGVAQVWIGAPGRSPVQVTAGDEHCVGPTVDGVVVTWLRLAASPRLETFSLIAPLPVEDDIAVINHIVGLGQSLSVGERSTPPLSTTPPLPGRLLMLSGGVRSLGSSHSPQDLANIIPDPALSGMTDALERNDVTSGESPGTQAGYEFIIRRPSDEAVVVSLHGIGSTAYSELKKGTQRWRNMLAAIARVRAIALVNGRDYRFVGMHWDQGEAQVSQAAATYAAYMVELQSDLTSAVQELTGESAEAPVFLHQTSAFTKLGFATAGVPQGQLDAGLANPDEIIVVGPKYQMVTASDGVHLTAASSALSGALIGRAMAEHLAGDPVSPVHMVSALRSGTTVTVTFGGLEGDLTLDTSVVTDPGAVGLEWIDDSSSATINSGSVSITGPNTLTFTLSNTPTGANPKVALAARGTVGANSGPTTGARSPLRDGSADVNQHGAAMHRYAVHQTIPVTI